METIFLHYLTSAQWLVYILVFIGMVLEGEAILFVAFYLASGRFLKLDILLLVVFTGVFLGDILWYKLGVYLEKIPFIQKHAPKITKHLVGIIFLFVITHFISKIGRKEIED